MSDSSGIFLPFYWIVGGVKVWLQDVKHCVSLAEFYLFCFFSAKCSSEQIVSVALVHLEPSHVLSNVLQAKKTG